jgi:hypothetical protein
MEYEAGPCGRSRPDPPLLYVITHLKHTQACVSLDSVNGGSTPMMPAQIEQPLELG